MREKPLKIVNTALVDMTGNVIKAGDVDMTVAIVLVNCALSATPDGKTRSKTEVASRYDLALRLNVLKLGDSIDIPVEMVARLTDDVLRVYTTIIAGQMLPVLDGQVVN
jgi:hypothetical protein